VPTRASHPLLRRVGARIRAARKLKRLTQEQLALNAGMDRSFVSGTERGEFNISILALAKLARVLKVPLTTLFDGD
jgi:transcriptional regulator with XRE-family HTH domain